MLAASHGEYNPERFNLGFLLKALAFSTLSAALVYLARSSTENNNSNGNRPAADSAPIKDITCLNYPSISQICCESGYQRIDELQTRLSKCAGTHFYHNARQSHISNLQTKVSDSECALDCLSHTADGKFTQTMIVETDYIAQFTDFYYQRS